MSETKSGGWRNNKWTRAAIPALLLHCSVGTVYCWSMFSSEIGAYIGKSSSATAWAFSLAIFFLGMSAAFLGNVVEKNIHLSSLVATICFTVGMAGTGFFIWYGGEHQGSNLALFGIYLCYGCIMGIGLGTGYLSPVKTLMLWFSDHKGLATGLAVAGFGAAKAIASPIMEHIMYTDIKNKVPREGGVYRMFWILAAIYFVMMFVGHLLLKKPDGWKEPPKEEKISTWKVIKSRPISNYIGIWLMFYINITCGLAIISQEKQIVTVIGLAGVAATLSSISAIFNAGGRLGFSTWADYLKDRNTIYKLIFMISIGLTVLTLATSAIKNAYDGNSKNMLLVIIVMALIFMVNAGYGGGFSNVPTLLSDHYGMGNISAIHGLTLSAWAMAGLTGNQMATYIVKHFGTKDPADNPAGYQYVLYVTCGLYVVALLISLFMVKKSAKALEAEKAKKAAAKA